MQHSGIALHCFRTEILLGAVKNKVWDNFSLNSTPEERFGEGARLGGCSSDALSFSFYIFQFLYCIRI